MRTVIAMITMVVLASGPALSATKHNEAYFCDIAAADLNGKAEVKIKFNRRADIITEDKAWECDWFHGTKVYEGIGQALTYAELTNKQPGLVLFYDRNKRWDKNLNEIAKIMSAKFGIELIVYEVDKITGEAMKKE